MSRSASFFVAGILVGLLIATIGFSLVQRSQNLRRTTAAHVTVLKLAHSLDQNHPVHAAMEYMARRLSEKSGGTVQLRIFPNGQLGSETECIEQLQRGALAMTKTSAAPMESFIPEMALFGIPYAFRDEQQYWRVLESEIGQNLLDAGTRVRLRGLCYYDAGSRNFYTIDRPVNKPDDLRGLKIRVQKSKTSMDMVEALGGSPTPIPWGELYTALQQRMVDGAENNPPSFYTNRHFEVCKHLTLDAHTFVPDVLLISEDVWRTLPPQVQTWVREAAAESSVFQRDLWQQKTEEALQAVQDAGVTVYRPDTRPFIERVQAMHRTYDGTPVGRLLSQVKAME
jgi:tripartite ATP-independent transporter DctP family solute receptor